MTNSTEHVDVVIVGAGLSGIGAAYRLQTMCPDRSYVILDGRDSIGGTWDLFRYPGIRSDSDIFTLGYPFKPWKGDKSIADGASILSYIKETAAENGIDRHIRFGHKVTHSSWSSADQMWTVTAERTDGSGPATFTATFVLMCSGYYSYDTPYQPEFPGRERFEGPFIHPQFWPEDLDYKDKRVVVIGSGATAVTLVPSMADDAAHVTMLQRSPSYIMSLPEKDPTALLLRKILPEGMAHRAIRSKNAFVTVLFYQFCRRFPKAGRKLIQAQVARQLPKGHKIEPHFVPNYDPWDQRLCLVPNGDFFRQMRKGKTSVVTDQIETLDETGIQLASGQHLDADIIVSATGLTLQLGGGMSVELDGKPLAMSDAYIYRGHMLSGVPNSAMCIGYTNASWTLRVDLTWQSVCRLLNHMAEHGYSSATPTFDGTPDTTGSVFGLSSGYVTRGADQLPMQGTTRPWLVRQNYLLDRRDAKVDAVTDSMVFARKAPVAASSNGHDASPPSDAAPVSEVVSESVVG